MWQQNYDPLHSWPVSTLVSALPLAVFFYVLLHLRLRVWKAAMSGLTAAILLALFVFRMPPPLIGISALLGILIGWLRIAWILVAAIYLHNITLATGQFRVMEESIAMLTTDNRVQVILITLCFGAFLEGTDSGGAPIAMVGILLVGLGFRPLQAAKICLLANTLPLAWGGIGSPVRALASASGLSESVLSAAIGRVVPIMTAIMPIWLLNALVGWRKTREVLPAALVGGLSFALMQFYWSSLGRAETVDIMAALFSLLALILLLKIWRPAAVMTNLQAVAPEGSQTPADLPQKHSALVVLRAWSPFLLAAAFVFILGIPAVRRALTFSFMSQPAPFLNDAVMRMPPAAPAITPEPAVADLNIMAMHGTALFIGATVGGLLLGLSVWKALRIFGQTIARLVPALLGVSLMVGFLFVLRYSGMITIMGMALTRTGAAFPFFGVFIGWLGVALTGTDAGSNSLFAFLQSSAASQRGLDPALTVAAQAGGGVIGKMVDPQSILVSATATRQGGNEGEIFKTVFKHSLLLTALLGMIVLVTTYLFAS